MAIRDIEAGDIEAVTAIYNYYIRHTVISFEEKELKAAEMEQRVENLRDLQLPWLVAETEGEIIGYAYAAPWRARSAYRNSVESTVYLHHLHTGKGWGLRLYQTLLERLRQAKIHVVIGGIALPNPASVALHEKLGMQKVAHHREVGHKFGQWVDVGYWQLVMED